MKQQIEDRVLEYFQNAPLAAAQAVLQLAKGVVARRAPETSTSKPGSGGGGPRISAATRRKISATLKARHAEKAAKAAGDGAVRAASDAAPKLSNGKAASAGEGGGAAPEPSASPRHRKPAAPVPAPLGITMDE